MRPIEACSVAYQGYQQPTTVPEAEVEVAAIEVAMAKLEARRKQIVMELIKARALAMEQQQGEAAAPEAAPVVEAPAPVKGKAKKE